MSRSGWSKGELAILIVLPVALVLFAIDAVVLLEGDRADRAKAAADYAAAHSSATHADASTDGRP